MLTSTLPAYLYQQYNNDPDLLAFFTAYNNTSQQYLNQVNALNLPNYTVQSGEMLDWVGNSIYGIPRPYIPSIGYTLNSGMYDTEPYDTVEYDAGQLIPIGIQITSMSWSSGLVTATTATAPAGVSIGSVYIGNIFGVTPSGYNGVFTLTQTGATTFTYPLASNPGTVTAQGGIGAPVTLANDDLYQRVITWNFYKGDGYQFTTTWLKNRVYRFLTQTNGIPAPIPNTYGVSVTFGSGNSVTITIASALNAFAPELQSLLNTNALQTPFQYTFKVSY